MSISWPDFIKLILMMLGLMIAIGIPLFRFFARQIAELRKELGGIRQMVIEHYSRKTDLDDGLKRIDEQIKQGFTHIKEILELKTQR